MLGYCIATNENCQVPTAALSLSLLSMQQGIALVVILIPPGSHILNVCVYNLDLNGSSSNIMLCLQPYIKKNCRVFFFFFLAPEKVIGIYFISVKQRKRFACTQPLQMTWL